MRPQGNGETAMLKAWQLVVCVVVCALPVTAKGQFGGGYIYGQPQRVVLDIDDTVASDRTPVIVLDAVAKRDLANVAQALNQRIPHLDLQESPLHEAVKNLQKLSGVRITLDESAMADASIGTDTLISCEQRGATLRTVLDVILNAHGLAWAPANEGLVITTKEARDSYPKYQYVVVYPVSDLVSTPDGDDYNSLIDVLTTSINPNGWKEGGVGEATAAAYPAAGSIIVTNSWPDHEQIGSFLASLRVAKAQQGIRGVRYTIPGTSSTSADDEHDVLAPPTSRRRSRTRWSTSVTPAAPTTPAPQPRGGGGIF